MQLLEVACQVRGSWNQLRLAAEDLAAARAALEQVTARALSWNPMVVFRRPKPSLRDIRAFPADWEEQSTSAEASDSAPVNPKD